MKQIETGPKRPKQSVLFHSIRNISSPEDLENNRKIYTGHFPLKSILGFQTDENVRDYLVDAEGKMRRSSTSVHRAIKETLLERPQDFCVLNSGVVLVAKDIEIDEKQKILTLVKPSIINGAQTQGVIKDLDKDELLPDPQVHIKFEIIVTDDDTVIADTSIARNFQNDVMTISIAGRKGQLDELEDSVQKGLPESKLRKSESEWPSGEDFIDTEKLLQVITALVPTDLWFKLADGDSPNKVYTYNAKSKCLKDFQEIFKKAKDTKHPEHSKYKPVYKFYLDIAPQAWQLYLKWKSHQGFEGSRLREIVRDGKKIVDVPDGIVFPIIASLSEFAKQNSKNKWIIEPPTLFTDKELIKAAKSVYMNVAESNPQMMGKNKACYSALAQITSIYKKLSEAQSL